MQSFDGVTPFQLEDEPVAALRATHLVAACAAIGSIALFALDAYGIFSPWSGLAAVFVLALACIDAFRAPSRAREPAHRAALLLAAGSIGFLALSALLLWLTPLDALNSLSPLTAFIALPEQLVRVLTYSGFAFAVASLLFLAFVRAGFEAVLGPDEIILPSKAHKIERGEAKAVRVSELRANHLVLVATGERIPVDGVILEGEASIDESALTGAVTAVNKLPGMHAYAGSVVRSGRILVTVHAVGAETLAMRLQSIPGGAFENGASTKALRGVALAAGIGFGVSVASGLALFFVTNSLVAAVTGFALGLTLGAGAALAHSALATRAIDAVVARTGARVRTQGALQKLAEADTIVLERSGVLSAGTVSVEHVISFKPYTQQQVLNTAAALELHSEHRFARAIVSFARSMGAIGFQRVTDAAEEPGAGITGELNGKQVLVGSVAFIRKNKINVPEAAMLHAEEGKTIVLVAADRIVFGYIALVEATKEETARVVESIRRDGKQVVLLSGDHKLTAEAHAKSVGITEVIADATPAKKAVAYQKLRADGRVAASVANDVRVDAAVSLVVFTPRTKPSIVDNADILIRSDDLTTLEALSSALSDEVRARRVVPRIAWITGGVALVGACVGFGGLLAAPVLLLGGMRAVRAARAQDSLLAVA